MGFAAVQILTGVTKLSELGIDISKDWLAHLIKNLGNPVDSQDAATKVYIDDKFGVSQDLPSRALDTIYKNTSGKIRMVEVSLYCGTTVSAGSLIGTSRVIALVEDVTPPIYKASGAGLAVSIFLGASATGNIWLDDGLTFVVPPNYYYMLQATIGSPGFTPVIRGWQELDFG